jgi:hypothetical protein
MRKYVRVVVAREPFLTLGKASLQVFCAHIFFVFAGLALLYGEMEQLRGMTAIVLLVVTFVSLFLIAANEVRKTRAKKKQKQADSGTPRDAGQPPVTAAVSLVDPLAESGAVREAA